MWPLILAGCIVTCFIRISPALFSKAQKLNEYTRFIKFLDYSICLITGEVIYSIAFHSIPKDSASLAMIVMSVLTLSIAGFLMWRSGSLAKSYGIAIGFFVAAYYLT